MITSDLSSPIKQVGGNHYERLKIQPSILFRRLNCLTWAQCNMIKYASRYASKGYPIQDIEKVISYAELAINTDWRSTYRSRHRALVNEFIYTNGFDDFQKSIMRAVLDNRYHTVIEDCKQKIVELKSE